MGFFECCHYCKKRFAGCHGTCPDYKEQKRLLAEHKEAERRAKLDEPQISYARKRIARKNKYGY